MLVLISLTLSQAASILGVSTSASKADINAAYRSAISKYHPDANRNKSLEEQKKAEQMFKQVGMARKVMLNPDLAEPEHVHLNGSPSPSSTGRGSASNTSGHTSVPQSTRSQAQSGGRAQAAHGSASQPTAQTRPRSPQNYQASAASSQYVPQGYNTARSFHDNVEKVADPAEEELARIYENETRNEYLSFSDKARLTPSMGVSAIFLVAAIAMFFAMPSPLSALALGNPCVILAIASIVKMFTYDLFASYYVRRAIAKKLKRAWGVLFGVETAALGVIGTILFATHSDMSSPFSIPVMIALVLVGIAETAVSVLLSKKNVSKNNNFD